MPFSTRNFEACLGSVDCFRVGGWMDGGGLHDNLVCAVPGARYRIKIGQATRYSKLFRNRRPCLGIAVQYRNRSRRAFTLLKIDFKRFKRHKCRHKQNWKSSGMTVKVPEASLARMCLAVWIMHQVGLILSPRTDYVSTIKLPTGIIVRRR